MRHEVEASHQQHKVHKHQPVALQRDLALFNKYLGRVRSFFAESLALEVGVRFGETETKKDDEHWGSGAEPEEWAPSVANGIDESAGEDGGEEVAKGVALLEHTGDDTAGLFGAVFESCARLVTCLALDRGEED